MDPDSKKCLILVGAGFLVLAAGFLGNVIPQKISTTYTNCTLIRKSFSNVSDTECNKTPPYVLLYFMTVKDQFGIFQICSADSSPCGWLSSSGPYVCHSLQSYSLDVYNMMYINETYPCYFNHKFNYAFLYYDPTNYLQAKYRAGMVFLSLFLVSVMIVICLSINWFCKQRQTSCPPIRVEGEGYIRIPALNPDRNEGEKEGL